LKKRKAGIRDQATTVAWVLTHAFRRKRKQFFFEKENQKTFAPAPAARNDRDCIKSKSLLVPFFRKELLPKSLFLLTPFSDGL